MPSPQLSPILPSSPINPRQTNATRIATIMHSPTLLDDVENMVDETISRFPSFAPHRDQIVGQLEHELDHAMNHFPRQRVPDDDHHCNNKDKRNANSNICYDPAMYSVYRYDDPTETECTDEKGHVQSISSRNIPELTKWLKETNKLFFDTTLGDVINNTSYPYWNWAVVEDETSSDPQGEFFLNMVAVEDIYEFGTKHVFLADGMTIFAAGEMQIDRTNQTVRYNYNSSNISNIDQKLTTQIRIFKIFSSMLPMGYALINDQLNMQMSDISGVAYEVEYFPFYKTKACMSESKRKQLKQWLKQNKRSFDTERQINIKQIYKRLQHKLHKAGFTNLKYIGQGAFGKVYDATEDATGRSFAVKVSRQISLTEIDGSLRLEHPNIIHARRFMLQTVAPEQGGQPGELEQVLVMNKCKPFDVTQVTSGRDAMRICYEVASGLHFLHQNDFYHCDLKPDNLLVHPSTNMTLIADLNLLGDSNASTLACGHIGWIAPENIRYYNPDVIYGIDGKKNDVFMLGLLFSFVLSGGRMLVPHLDDDVQTYDDIVNDTENTVEAFMNEPHLDWMDADIGPGTRDAWTKLIIQMVTSDVDVRFTIEDVFASEVFYEMSWNNPIPGRVIAHPTHSYPIHPSSVNYSCFAALVESAVRQCKFYPACIFFMFHVYANCVSDAFQDIFPTSFDERQRAEFAAFFSAKVTSKYYAVDACNSVVSDMIASFGSSTREDYSHVLTRYLSKVNGCIRVVNMYDKASSLQEVEWALDWLIKVCLGEQTYEDPNTCHYKYCSEMETADMRMDRLPKRSVLGTQFLTHVQTVLIPHIEQKASP
jgi:serine/threonine protein kinase